METVYIGLGSNLDEPAEHVLRAWGDLHHLPDTRCQALSSLYHSEPVGPPGQPDYVNAAAKIETALTPLELLDSLHAIEGRHQRVRTDKWGPRTLDLDMLLFGTHVIKDLHLQIPHPQLRSRNFVLAPLADLDPGLALPCGALISDLLKACGWHGLARWPAPPGADGEQPSRP